MWTIYINNILSTCIFTFLVSIFGHFGVYISAYFNVFLELPMHKYYTYMAINNEMPKLFDLFSINACNQFRIPTSGYTNK